MALAGKGVLYQIICQVQFQEPGMLHRGELPRAVLGLHQSRLGCALLSRWVSSLTYLAIPMPTQHIWPRLWQEEIPTSLWERDRAGGKEAVPRIFHIPLPFPMCLSSRARVVLTTNPRLPGPQQTSVPAIADCWRGTESPSDESWHASSCATALGRSFTPPVGGRTPEKNPCLFSPASSDWGCGWWSLT